MQKAENRELHISADRENQCFHRFSAQYEFAFNGKSGPEYKSGRIDMDKHTYNMLKARWDEAGENERLFTTDHVSHTSALNWRSDLPL